MTGWRSVQLALMPNGNPTLQNLQNIASSLGEKGATAFDTAREALGKGDIFSKEFLTAAVPGQIGAAGDLAYFQAAKALDEYDQQQANLGAMGVAGGKSLVDAFKSGDYSNLPENLSGRF